MKKYIALFAVVAVFGLAQLAYADSSIAPADCPADANHRVFSQDDATITGCIPNATWDANMTSSVHNGQKLPVVSSGTTIIDEHGVINICSLWIAPNCVDTTGTDAYRTAMQTIARSLVGMTLSTTRFDGWIASVK